MRIKEVLNWGFEELAPTSDSARLDAELLLAYVLKKSSTFLFTQNNELLDRFSFFPIHWRKYQCLIKKRKQGIPIAYLVGHKEFYFLDFKVNRHVLVPRPDTEILVECVIDYFKSEIRNPKSEINSKSKISNTKQIRDSKFEIRNLVLLDVGTGSGCIPISVLKNAEGVRAIVTDISRAALRVARANIQKHHLTNRIKLIKSDLLAGVSANFLKGKEIVLTANLPYLPDKIIVAPELGYEPSISLYGGSDGMDVYKRLMNQIQMLKPKAIFLELFEWQIATLENRLEGYELKYIKTMSGDARCLMMERV